MRALPILAALAAFSGEPEILPAPSPRKSDWKHDPERVRKAEEKRRRRAEKRRTK